MPDRKRPRSHSVSGMRVIMQELAGLQLVDARLLVWKAQIWESAAPPTEPLEEWHEWKIMQPPKRKLVRAIVILSPISTTPTPCLIPNDRLQEFPSLLGPSLIWLRDPAFGRLRPDNPPSTSQLKAQPAPVLNHLRVSALCFYAADPSQPPRERYLGSTLLKQ